MWSQRVERTAQAMRNRKMHNPPTGLPGHWPPRVRDLVRSIADARGLSAPAIVRGGNQPYYVDARAEVYKALREPPFEYSFPRIGRLFGKHHTTIISSVQRFKSQPPPVAPYDKDVPDFSGEWI